MTVALEFEGQVADVKVQVPNIKIYAQGIKFDLFYFKIIFFINHVFLYY